MRVKLDHLFYWLNKTNPSLYAVGLFEVGVKISHKQPQPLTIKAVSVITYKNYPFEVLLLYPPFSN